MPDPSSSVRATAGGYDTNALINLMLTPRVPYSEWAARRRYGAGLDTSQIEAAIRFAEYGIMWPVTDLEQETLALNPAAQSFLSRAFVPISMADWDVTPAEGPWSEKEKKDAERIATDTRSMIRGIRGGAAGGSFRQGLLDLAWGFAWGRAASEKHMIRTVRSRPEGGVSVRTVPVALNWIAPQRLSYDEERRLVPINRFHDAGLFVKRGPALDDVPGKFVSLQPRVFSDLPEREGLAVRFLYWLLFDRFQWRRRLEVMERMADPKPIIEQDIQNTMGYSKLPRNLGGEGGGPGDDGASLDEAAAAARAVMDRFGVFVGRPGEHLRIEYPPSEISSLFSEGSDQILRYLEMLATHALMTAKETAPRAGLVVQKGDQELLLDFRGALVAEAIQRDLVDHHVELNFGPDALVFAPTFSLRTTNNRDRTSEVERILKTSAAVPVGVGVLYEASGTRPPNPGEATITPPAPAGPFGAGGGGGVASPGSEDEPRSRPAQPHGDTGSQETEGRLRELAESADDEDQRDAVDEEATAAMSRWFASTAVGRKVQPSSANGSPETLVERGVREGTRSTSTWAATLADAADGTDAGRIYRTLQHIAASLDVEAFTRALERRLVHGAMLGGFDADYEMSHDAVIEPVHFVAPPLVVPGVPASSGVGGFATMPFGEALKAFASKKILPRRVFDRLGAAAKRKAFTVAGLAKKDMLATAHDELHKAMTDGDDLRAFSRRLADRFDAAGWTRLNPSHVENVFRTNIMGAYSAGRREQMDQPAVLAARPYRQILGVKDDRTRVPHRQAIGSVLDAKDPFWDRCGPPFGFQCRCRAVSRSAADLKRLGLTPTIGAALRGLPDEGWDAGGSLL